MIIDVKRTKKPEDGSIAVYVGGEWRIVGKSAFLQPYMRRNDETESRFADLKAEFDSLKAESEALKAEFAALLGSVASTKAAINEKLAEYHEVLRLLTDGE